MKCTFFVKLKLQFLLTFLLPFFLRSFQAAMGCFLSCLRSHDDDEHLLPTSQHNSRGVVTSQNPLSSLLSRAFKRKEVRLLHDGDNLDLGSQRDDRGLEEEPEVQCTIPATPIKFCEELGNGRDSLLRTPCSSAYIAQDIQCDSCCSKDTDEGTKHSPHTVHETCEDETEIIATTEPLPPTTDIQRKSKSLRFECDTDLTSRGYKQSPYPTPLKISDDMQTPGTVYSAAFISQPNASKPRVRSQILYLNNHLAKNISRCEILEEEDSDEPSSSFEYVQNATPIPKIGLKEVSYDDKCELKDSDELSSSFEYVRNATPIPKIGLKEVSYDNKCELKDSDGLSSSFEYVQNATPIPKMGLKEVSYDSKCELEAGLSWLKNASVISEERNSGKETSNDQIPNLCESPADKSVFGMVDAQWNEEEDPQIPSPKLWYGNGIPNTTNKYKEDRKVNWHATPFVVRLEKALSDNCFDSQRCQVSGKRNASDNEDNDTALSQLHPSIHTNL